MNVVKRSLCLEPVSFDKILQRISRECDASPERGLAALTSVNAAGLAQAVIGHLHDNISTTTLDDYTASLAASMSSDDLEYGELASRVAVSNLHKNTPACMAECIDRIPPSSLSPELVKVVLEHRDAIEAAIDYRRDYLYDTFGLSTLCRGYLLTGQDGKIAERPQHMLMRTAIGIHGDDIPAVLETYDMMSRRMFTHASPTLFNAGTRRPQLSSCFLLPIESDSLDGIMNTLHDCATISKHAGGIGVSCSNLRAPGSVIRGTNGRSAGVVPMLRIFNQTARAFNQGGKRAGSIAMYIEPWHPDIFSFAELRKNHGDEEHRARDLFTAVWMPDLFMRRMIAGEEWSLFCPDECPGLQDVHGAEFDALYLAHERSGKAKRRVAARELWTHLVRCQIETGTPYLCFKDSCNAKSNQSHLGTIRSSNLCTEIIEYSSPDETAVCNLASICLPSFVRPDGSFDYDGLRRAAGVVTRNIDRVISKTFYPTDQARRSNLRHRPIGVGVQGLADAFAMMKIPFDSPEAARANKDIFQTIYYGCVDASVDLAERLGAHESHPGSPASRGLLQFDLWGVTPDPLPGLDWAALKSRLAAHGLRNSLLVALMPTASTSQIMGNNESFEPFSGLVFMKKTLVGEAKVVNKHLVRDLKAVGLWNRAMKDRIIAARDSVQGIEDIPADIRARYKTVWEVKQRVVIDMQADRGPFVCQSASNNLYCSAPSVDRVSNMLAYTWTKGLKTGLYYLRVQPAIEAQQVTVAPSRPACTEEVCVMCSA